MNLPNFHNRTIWTGDNLPIMRGMNSKSVDLIYLDPPFNSKSNYAAPIGSKAAGAEFKDTWALSDLDIAWLDLIESKHPKLNRVIQASMTDSDKSYLIYMVVRLLEMHRILKETGSMYLHCDPTMSHYLKLIMDAIFKHGQSGFRNEIVWCYTAPSNVRRHFPRKHDVILFYANERSPFNRDAVLKPYSAETIERRGRVEGQQSIISASVETQNKRSKKAVAELFGQGKVPEDWWVDIPILTNQVERTGYPTQKPLALLERIIKASSNENDMVFDPFCGCATTLVAADRLERQWIGIDISLKAVELVELRIKQDQGRLFENIVPRKDIPQRTDIQVPRQYNSVNNKKYLYGQQGGYCNGCSVHFEMRNLEVDHIIAKSQGGTDHIENLQLLCASCNRVKGNRGQEHLIAKLQGRRMSYA